MILRPNEAGEDYDRNEYQGSLKYFREIDIKKSYIRIHVIAGWKEYHKIFHTDKFEQEAEPYIG